MSQLNKIFLIGRVTQDPEARHTASGTPVTKFTLAVNRSFRKQDGTTETDFIDCVSWAKLAELMARYLYKGKLVMVEGRLQLRSYETRDGSRRKVAEVICENVQFLDRAPARSGTSGEGNSYQAESRPGPSQPTSRPPQFPAAEEDYGDDYYGGIIPPDEEEETPF